MTDPPTTPESRRCPACGYDVAPSLDEGLAACPECDGSISRDTCLADGELADVKGMVVRYSAATGVCWAMGAGMATLDVGYQPARIVIEVCALGGLALVVFGGWRTHRRSQGSRRRFGRLGALDLLVGRVLMVFFGGLLAFVVLFFVGSSLWSILR